jgi:hypothetical protein
VARPAYQTVLILDPIETGILHVRAQFLTFRGTVQRSSNTLHRVEEKLRARQVRRKLTDGMFNPRIRVSVSPGAIARFPHGLASIASKQGAPLF